MLKKGKPFVCRHALDRAKDGREAFFLGCEGCPPIKFRGIADGFCLTRQELIDGAPLLVFVQFCQSAQLLVVCHDRMTCVAQLFDQRRREAAVERQGSL